MSWTPPRRPEWMERLIAHGEAVGGPQHLVSLGADEMLATAQRSTGLTDFGDRFAFYRERYDVPEETAE